MTSSKPEKYKIQQMADGSVVVLFLIDTFKEYSRPCIPEKEWVKVSHSFESWLSAVNYIYDRNDKRHTSITGKINDVVYEEEFDV